VPANLKAHGRTRKPGPASREGLARLCCDP